MKPITVFSAIILVVGAILLILPRPENSKPLTLPENNNTIINPVDANKSEAKKASSTNENSKSTAFILANTRWFDGEQWHQTDLKVSGGLIVDQFETDELAEVVRIDLRGRYVIPGLIDAHTHNWGDALSQALKFGVTTEIDMFTESGYADEARKQRSELSKTRQSDFYSAGILVTSSGGHGTEYGMDIPTISAPDEADAFVKERIKEGSDFIKIVYHHKNPYGPYTSIDYATMEALIKATHQLGKKAVVHVSHMQAAREAVEAGADGLVHIFDDKKIDTTLINLIKEKNVFVIPTLSVIAAMANESSLAFLNESSYVSQNLTKALRQQLISNFNVNSMGRDSLGIAMFNVKQLFDAGVTILAGTDAPNPGTTYGASIHNELHLLVKSGLSVSDAIKAATTNVASRFTIDNRGYLGVGSRADFIVLTDDPEVDIKNTQTIESIYKNGFKLEPELPSVSNAARLGSTLLSDFDDKQWITETNFRFFATSDTMMNGNSSANIEFSESACRSGNSAYVSGEIGKKFPFPWAGIMVSFSEKFDKAVNVSNYHSVNFTTQGGTGDYRLLVFVKGQQRPQEIPLVLSGECESHAIALNQHPSVDWTSITGLAWVASANQSRFAFALDDVGFE